MDWLGAMRSVQVILEGRSSKKKEGSECVRFKLHCSDQDGPFSCPS